MRRRHYRRGRGGPVDRLRSSRFWPPLLATLLIILIIVLFFMVKDWFLPSIRKMLTPGEISVAPMKTEEPIGDLSERIREVLLTSKYKHVSYPDILGDDIIFAAGSDNAQNPKLDEMYIANTQTSNARTPETVEGILATKGNILHLDATADYIAYFDGANTGGGQLMLYDRTAKTARVLCEVQYGWVKPHLAGRFCIWVQRTGTAQEKLLCMDLVSGETVTLALYDNSAMGLSEPGVCEKEVVYIEEDPAHPDSERYNLIVIQPLDGGERTEYTPGLYAYKPVTNGRAIAFTDSLGSTDGSLYLSVGGAMQKKIADNVTDYGLGENFLAYSQFGRIYIYDWSTNKTSQLTIDSEYALLATVSEHAVAWFDITMEKRERDILKFAVLD